ncbi:unnamed protein product [marine sediment metagenome]|uniref:Uncharacterized protein n=1 Tax=marine sediment metagenome TaxID=412755 RepID=X1NZZ5_9ZZZZ
MDDKKSLLKSIGWTDQLIDECMEGSDYTIIENSSIDSVQDQISLLESDLGTIIIKSDTTNITDGAKLGADS